MHERKETGVQRLPLERLETLPNHRIFYRSTSGAVIAVYRIAHERKSAVMAVNPDLMRPAGGKAGSQHDSHRQSLLRVEQCFRRTAPIFYRYHSHPGPVARIPSDGRDHPSVIPRRNSPGDRPVVPSGGFRRYLRRERTVSRVILCNHEQAGRFPVQTVYDSRSLLASDHGERPAVGDEGVHEGSGVSARAWMNGKARALVHDQQTLVFVHDVERDRLGLDRRGPRPLGRNSNYLALIGSITRARRLPGYLNGALRNPSLGFGPGNIGKSACDKLVQPHVTRRQNLHRRGLCDFGKLFV